MSTQSLAADLAPVAHSANAMADPPPLPSSEHLLPDQLLVRLRSVLMRKSSLPSAPAGQIDDQVQSMGVRRAWANSLGAGGEDGTIGEGVAGEVEAVGSALSSWYAVGDRVTGVGLLAANACLIPAAVSDEHACFAGLVAAAVQAARLVHPRLGDWLAVIGLQGEGLLAVQCAVRAGARVLAVDPDDGLLNEALALGAIEVWTGEAAGDLAEEGTADGPPVTDCHGVIVTPASGIAEPLQAAIAVARRGASVALLGIDPDSVPLRALTDKGLALAVAHGPAVRTSYMGDGEELEGGLRDAVTLMALAHVRASRLPVRYVPLSAVRDYFRVRSSGSELDAAPADALQDSFGAEWVVIDFGEGVFDPAPLDDERRASARSDGAARACVVGVVGIDRAARTHLLPRLRSLPEVVLHTILSDRTMARDDVRRRFGFARSTTEPEAVLKPKDVSLVLLLEDYAQDIGLICKGLAKGKVVLVDHPFARDHAALDQVLASQQSGGGVLQVGFHRRFAPLIQDARIALDSMRGRRQVVIHANAGRSLAELRAAQSEEASASDQLELCGEIGHFVDLARHLISAPITAVEASTPLANGVVHDVAAQLHFADGSIATLIYTRFGESAFSREVVEVFAEGAILRLDNLREMQRTEGAIRQRCRSILDRGHRAMLMAVAEAITVGATLPFDTDEQTNTLRALLALRRAIETGQRVTLG
jgi:predicted dehydrogenase/threonine dehydrogenase-like Zn-dependent dehydrogenase